MNIHSLLFDIFFGEFGLLTMTPRYLFTVLLPIMLVVDFLQSFIPRFSYIKTHSQLFYSGSFLLTGLGCTTAGLLALSGAAGNKFRHYFTLLLVLVVPCSAQLSLIMVFGSMVSLRVFVVFACCYLLIIFVLIFILKKLAHQDNTTIELYAISTLDAIKNALHFVFDAALPFAVGSILITLAIDLGLLNLISKATETFFESFLGLPKEVSGIFLLNFLKRDFGSASLITMTKYFTADQLIETLLMLLFFVPCFNSFIILIKEERLPKACFLWLGSLILSFFIGKLFRCIFSICFI